MLMSRRASQKLLVYEVINISKKAKFKCCLCGITFQDESSISVHLSTLRHLSLPTPQYLEEPEFECNVCGSFINKQNLSTHQCIDKAIKSYWEVVKFIDEFGSPNMCFICRGKLFETPAHLIIHILMVHSWNEFDTGSNVGGYDQFNRQVNCPQHQTFVCPLCEAVFKTSDPNVIHRHAFEVHVPEIGIAFIRTFSGLQHIKYNNHTEIKGFLAKHLYTCLFPNNRVKRYPLTLSKNINREMPLYSHIFCSEIFSNVLCLTAHLTNFHFLRDLAKDVSGSEESTKKIKRELENRVYVINQDLNIKRKNLFDRQIITHKIPAQIYCMECFTLFRSHIRLQVHYICAHLNRTWNQCSLCDYDCKMALVIPQPLEPVGSMSPFTKESQETKSDDLMWRALWNHEQYHYQCIVKLLECNLSDEPYTHENQNLLPPLSEEDKHLLRPPQSQKEDPFAKVVKRHRILSDEMCEILQKLYENNKLLQTEAIIQEFLAESNLDK